MVANGLFIEFPHSFNMLDLYCQLKRWKVFWQDCQVRSTLKIYYNPCKSRFY